MTGKQVELPSGVHLNAREMTSLDRGFVATTWIASARSTRNVELSVYDAWYPILVDHLLDVSHTVCLFGETPSIVHGWACVDRNISGVVHWAYVPYDLRREGIARAAISTALETYPKHIHVTSSLPHSFEGSRFSFNPFLLMRG